MRTLFTFALGAVTLSMCGVATFAQQPVRPARAPAAQQARQRPNVLPAAGAQQRTVNRPINGQNADSMIATMLAYGNEEEAALGSFASEHAKHKDVQQFADKMSKQHMKLAEQLRKWAPGATLGGSDSSTRSEQPQARSPQETTSAPGFDPLNVCREITQRSISSTKKELSSKNGTDFDMAYIGSQCVLHQQMIDKATVLREYASPELQSTIDDGISSAKDHLAQVKELIKKLAHDEKRSNS